ncbi:MAG: MFS transporter [Planctomycetes bacterium]|nr:MFS transporter [Planctomycetota bacterium]
MLGFVSLLTDTASEVIVPLLPFFLASTLGAGALALGWIEGLADATASVLKLLSGRWADRLGRNRPLVLAGYLLSSCARPFVAAAGSAGHVLVVRLLDRTGKGIRSSPRDALLAASVPEAQRGAAFGLHRSMDHAGAVLGPLLAAGYLSFVSQDLRLLFWLTAIPGAAAVLVLWLGVEEDPVVEEEPQPLEPDPTEPAPRGSDRALTRFLVPLGLFTLGNASDVFLLLKAGGSRAPLGTLPLLWLGLHGVKTLSSVPGGKLADRVGRRRVIATAWLLYAAVYVGFAFAESQLAIWSLFLVYGLYHGLSEGPEKALVAQLAPPRARGSAFGLYYLTLGLLSLAASVLFGALWELAGSRAAFLTSAALAVAAVVALATLRPTPAEVAPATPA